MEVTPLLFDLGKPKPTTRDVADMVRLGGADALTDAMRRADAVRYMEVRCRSALNRVKGMPFGWTLNPYRGCTHGCHYCYARRYQSQFELGPDDEFASIIVVKTNIVDVLRRELQSPRWGGEYVAIGTATDCYQPIEGHYKLTRGMLEALHDARNPVGVITKGPMVVRDKALLADMSRAAGCTVYVSVATVDEEAWRQLEPGTSHPLQRLRAVRELADAGVRVGVLMNPIVPGISSRRAFLERTMAAIAEHGACFVGHNVMFLEGGTREHFLRWLASRRPELVERYTRLYASKYAPQAYRATIAGIVNDLRRQFHLDDRGRTTGGTPSVQPLVAQAEQRFLAW